MGSSKSAFDLTIPKDAFTRVIQGKDLVDSSYANRLAEDLKSWAKKRGVANFTYWMHPFFEKHQKQFEISHLTGLSLCKKEVKPLSFLGFEEASFLTLDPTFSPFIYQESLWIPSLVFSEKGDARDFKIPLLRSLEKLKCQKGIIPQVKIHQKFYLFDKELVENCPDLFRIGKRVYDSSRIPEEGASPHSFLKEVMKDAHLFGVDVTIKKSETEKCQYEIVFNKNEVSMAIDQSLLLMEIMEAVGRKQKIVPLFIDSFSEVMWFPFEVEKQDPLSCQIYMSALIHAVHIHEDLLKVFCNQQRFFIDLDQNLLSFPGGFRSPFHAALGLCTIQAVFAESLGLILNEYEETPLKGRDVLKKFMQESVKRKEQPRTFAQIYAPYSDKKTIRCFSGILNSQELDDFHRIHLEYYLKEMEEEMSLMIEIFKVKILPLHNKFQDPSLEAKEAIFAVDDLEQFRKKISDLGVEAKSRAYFEIGAGKMEHARILLNRHFVDL